MLSNSVIITKRNVDGSNNPISVSLTETKQVIDIHNCIPTNQSIDKSCRVKITGLTEVYNMDEISEHTFFVDYEQGIIYFSPLKVGKSVTYTYMGTGYILISANRIFTKTDASGNIVQTLEEAISINESLIQDVKHAIARIDETRLHMEGNVNQALGDLIEELRVYKDKTIADFDIYKEEVINDFKELEDILQENETIRLGKERTHENNEVQRRVNERVRQENETQRIKADIKRAENEVALKEIIAAASDTNISGTVASEVIAARVGKGNTVYNNLKDRIDSIENHSDVIEIEEIDWKLNTVMYAGIPVYIKTVSHSLRSSNVMVEFFKEGSGLKQLITYAATDENTLNIIIDEAMDGYLVIKK